MSSISQRRVMGEKFTTLYQTFLPGLTNSINGVILTVLIEMGTKERRAREKADLRRAILDAARALFAEQGFEAVSMRKIAEKIEYSPTTLYLYFHDKREILAALIVEGFGLLRARVVGTETPDPVERLRASLRCYIAFAFEQPHYYALMFQLTEGGEKQGLPHLGEIMEAGAAAFEIICSCVRDGQASGQVRTDQPCEILSHAVWAHIHGAVALGLAQRLEMLDPQHHDLFFETSIEVTLRGLQVS
jgi:AcrR family transcriptional regulator